jgi:hypothetical protein
MGNITQQLYNIHINVLQSTKDESINKLKTQIRIINNSENHQAGDSPQIRTSTSDSKIKQSTGVQPEYYLCVKWPCFIRAIMHILYVLAVI